MYNPKSTKAEEFIDHNEVLETLKYAQENKNNIELIDKILEKARLGKGLSHREAAVLLDCEIEEKNQEIFELAKKIKQDYYGNRIVLFAPLYLSNYCVNGCVYCPYHAKNKHIPRKKMTQEEFASEFNVAFSTINRWENGKTVPNMKAMKQMKEFCEKKGFSFDELEEAWLEQTKNK